MATLEQRVSCNLSLRGHQSYTVPSSKDSERRNSNWRAGLVQSIFC